MAVQTSGLGNWQAAVAAITGLVAKENVVGTFGILYGFAEVAEDGAEVWGHSQQALLQRQRTLSWCSIFCVHPVLRRSERSNGR